MVSFFFKFQLLKNASALLPKPHCFKERTSRQLQPAPAGFRHSKVGVKQGNQKVQCEEGRERSQ